MARLTVGFWLRAMDEVRQLFAGDLVSGLIFVGLLQANVGHVENRVGGPNTHIDDPVPDEDRRPVTALALAERLGLPRETVRRHIRNLEAAGLCVARKEGLIVPQSGNLDPLTVTVVLRNAANLRLLVAQLKASGFPPPTPT